MVRLILDFPAQETGASVPVSFGAPAEVVSAWRVEEVAGSLARVEAAVAAGRHAAGFVSYEAAPALDGAMRVGPPGPLPLVWFGLYDRGPEPLRDGIGGSSGDGDGHGSNGAPDLALEPEGDAGWHAGAVRRVRAAIAEGRTYQVNLTTRLRSPFPPGGDPLALFHRMRRLQAPGYHAYLDLGRHVIVSASPELFFETRGDRIRTRPMKGTRRRGRWVEEDRQRSQALLESEKDRAENLMIVDLLRNDLGRVCRTGSIRVPALFAVEAYRTVWQMTSTVEGTLRPGTGLGAVLTALFPCGSVTGAPKISTMQLIAELEPSPRGVYCGAIGWVRPGGDATFSVPIRTAWIDRETGVLEYGAGGGVVWDSTPGGEYDELLAKSVVLTRRWPRFDLLETLGLVDGSYLRLERHLARMRASARYFERPFPEAALRRELGVRAAEHPAGRHLVRLTLGEDGGVAASARPMEPLPRPMPVALSDLPVDPDDVFLHHKTTHREVYERRLLEAPAGVSDLLLRTADGRLTEFTRGNVVVELDGTLCTPPRTDGVLPGCLRAELLEAGRLVERTLRVDDLGRATGTWFLNSARGWIETRLR